MRNVFLDMNSRQRCIVGFFGLLWMAASSPTRAQQMTMASSPDATVLSVYAGHPHFSLWVSRDPGESWNRKPVRGFQAMAIDTDNTVLVAAANELLAMGESETYRGARVGSDVLDLVADRHRVVALVGEDRRVAGSTAGQVLESRDGGRTWTRLAELGSVSHRARLELDPTGRLLAFDTSHLRGHGDVSTRRWTQRRDGSLARSFVFDGRPCLRGREPCISIDDVRPGAHGYSYGVVDADTERPFFAQILPTNRRIRIALSGAVEEQAFDPQGWRVSIVHNGRITVAQMGGVTLRLIGARAHVLDRAAPPQTELIHVDSRGFLWWGSRAAAGDGRAFVLHRFSRRHGWTQMR